MPGTLPNGTDPNVFLDFKNGIYTVGGVPTLLTDIATENAAYENWDGESTIVSGTGLTATSSPQAPVFINDALNIVLADGTIIYTFVLADQTSVLVENCYFPDFTFNYFSFSQKSGLSANVNYISDGVDQVDQTGLAVGRHKVAFTCAPGLSRVARSTDGGAVIAIDPAYVGPPLPNFLGIKVGQGSVLESIGFYPVQPDADLPSLSAL